MSRVSPAWATKACGSKACVFACLAWLAWPGGAGRAAGSPPASCDLNGDGQVTGADIDLLYSVVRGQTPPGDGRFDINRDGLVTREDVAEFVENIYLLNTRFGDADLDGDVDLGDLARLANNYGKPAGWAGGDFDGSGTVDIGDLGALAGYYGFARPATFWRSTVEDVRQFVGDIRQGQVTVAGVSPGGREVYLVSYGQPNNLMSASNYDSAVGGGNPAYYANKPAGTRPTVYIVGPVHGSEMEGIVGLLNLLNVAETGQDLRGRAWPTLMDRFRQCRVLIIPCGNPDGRARCVPDNWIGTDAALSQRWGMGIAPDGTMYSWPSNKLWNPMPKDVIFLGAYYNDAGVNIMQDEFFNPMAPETKAILEIARKEAPDYIVSLHSHGVTQTVEQTAFAPRFIKNKIQAFSVQLMNRYNSVGLGGSPLGTPTQDGPTSPGPTFNLSSALHHICGGTSFVFECSAGIPEYRTVTKEQILDIELIMYEELFKFAVANPVVWTR